MKTVSDYFGSILVLDFGGQYNQLIARRVREQHVYAEIKPYNRITVEEIQKAGYKGIIFTGGPNSVYDKASPHYDPAVLNLGIPILCICYGCQLMAYMSGGGVGSAENSSEYGKTIVKIDENALFKEIPAESVCLMSHTDYVSRLPKSFVQIAHTDKCPYAAIYDEKRMLYGVQFHPEVTHTVFGKQMFKNFIFEICGCNADWRMEDFIKQATEYYHLKLKGKRVLLALSGGVDSSVAAVLLHKAIGEDLTCVFVDHGLLRKDEGDFVEKTFRDKFGMTLIRVNAEERFLSKLSGVTEPEKKRKIIGEEFIRVFEDEAKKIGKIYALAQGTIYPDVIESGKGDSAVIKSHHNVGGLPDVISFNEIVEPLRDLFKDEVREVGERLGIPHELVWRQPFPGPGLAVRILGTITKEKTDILREADAIFRKEIANAHLEQMTNQYFAVLTDSRSVGVMGDERTYGYTVALRAVSTDDFMTAEWTRLPYDVLEKASSRITNPRLKAPAEKTIKTTSKTIKQTGKGTIKTAQKSVKTAEKTSKAAIKTTQQAVKAAQKTTQTSVKAAQRAAQAARATAKAAVATAKAAVKATIAAVKAIIAATKALIAAVAAGGWVAVVVIIVICLVALIVGSCFGIFFSNEDTNTDSTPMTQVVAQLNTEYYDKIEQIKADSNAEDIEIISNDGLQAIRWNEVLAVYAVKVTTDGTGADVVTITDDKVEMLRTVLWDMNAISHTTKSVTKTVDVTETDENGNEKTVQKSITQTVLTINLTHKSYTEMSSVYGFNADQTEQLELLMSDEYDSMWAQLLGGYSAGTGEIMISNSEHTPIDIFSWPLPKSYSISSPFGYRSDPFTGQTKFHGGLDIAAPGGTPILAAADGIVEVANATDSWGYGYGYHVKIRHNDTDETLYAHCSSIAVVNGQEVKKGQVIAYVGTTGNSTGNHLHFEVYKNGERTNPLEYFN